MLFGNRMSQERREKINAYIDELEKHGPITERDFLQMDGKPQISFTVHHALTEYFGRNDDEGNRFVYRVLSRFGCNPETHLSPALVNGYEDTRQLLLKRPKDLKELERLLDE